MENNKMLAVMEACEEAICKGNDAGALMVIGAVWELATLGELSTEERNGAMKRVVRTLKDAKLAENGEYEERTDSAVTDEMRREALVWLEKADSGIVRDAASFLRVCWKDRLEA